MSNKVFNYTENFCNIEKKFSLAYYDLAGIGNLKKGFEDY